MHGLVNFKCHLTPKMTTDYPPHLYKGKCAIML